MDKLSAASRSALMARIHGKNTKPEITVRRLLWGMGYRFRLHDRRLAGRPDIVLPRHHKAIFVHGCFWHSHRGCRKATIPKTRSEFWTLKLALNVKRDRKAEATLVELGWNILVIWECELRDLKQVAEKLANFMQSSEIAKITHATEHDET